jgi:tRNA threonylcarbamoyladenosine biosynthesis protein TsaB
MTHHTLLALDTSTGQHSVALQTPDQVDCRVWQGHGTGDLLVQETHALVHAAGGMERVQAVVVGTGPGSFTGLRVGAALARGLADASDTPLYGVPSVLAMLQTLPHDRPVWVAMDVRKGQIWGGPRTPGPGLEAGRALRLCPLDEFRAWAAADAPGDVLRVGDGWGRIDPALQAEHPRVPVASDLLGWLHAGSPVQEGDAVEPIYVRPSDAELHGPKQVTMPRVDRTRGGRGAG